MTTRNRKSAVLSNCILRKRSFPSAIRWKAYGMKYTDENLTGLCCVWFHARMLTAKAVVCSQNFTALELACHANSVSTCCRSVSIHCDRISCDYIYNCRLNFSPYKSLRLTAGRTENQDADVGTGTTMDHLDRAAGDNRGQEMKKVAVVVVLGEIARSPRMRMHAESFAKENYFVHIISNSGNTAVPDSLSKNPTVHLSYVSPVPKALDKLPKLIAYVLKFAWQFISLSWIFLISTFLYGLFPSCIMVQNPPSIPTLPVMCAYSMIFRSQFIVDWHNYGYTILQLSAGDSSILTKVYKWAEFYFGSYGNLHLSVTAAMAADLKARIGIEAVPFHDRPGPLFKPLSDTERLRIRKSFAGRYPSLSNSDAKMLVSSTSWTEDEDFGILLSALHRYDSNAKVSAEAYPRLIVFITGKGPLKSYYEGLIAKLDAEFVEIHLPWLEHEEYPQLLGCADLGVSLHTSSSGLDLPMKVVDMFGCGLPVAAIEFSCLSELVRQGDNGLIFNSSEELADQIIQWFSPTKNQVNSKSEAFRKNLRSFHLSSWHTNWRNKVLPHLK